MARFIPTPVGNAPPLAVTCPAPTVHPHARGERQDCTYAQSDANRSSPRRWGTLY